MRQCKSEAKKHRQLTKKAHRKKNKFKSLRHGGKCFAESEKKKSTINCSKSNAKFEGNRIMDNWKQTGNQNQCKKLNKKKHKNCCQNVTHPKSQ